VGESVGRKETLLGKPEEPEKCYLVFSVRNRSSWLAFLTFVAIVEDAKPLQVSS
jgi:hypothetical protein